MKISNLSSENNELIHEVEKEFIEMMLLVDNKREQEHFKNITLMKIAKLKSNNKIINKLSNMR